MAQVIVSYESRSNAQQRKTTVPHGGFLTAFFLMAITGLPENARCLFGSFGTYVAPARAKPRGVLALGGRNLFAWLLYFVERLCVAGCLLISNRCAVLIFLWNIALTGRRQMRKFRIWKARLPETS